MADSGSIGREMIESFARRILGPRGSQVESERREGGYDFWEVRGGSRVRVFLRQVEGYMSDLPNDDEAWRDVRARIRETLAARE